MGGGGAKKGTMVSHSSKQDQRVMQQWRSTRDQHGTCDIALVAGRGKHTTMYDVHRGYWCTDQQSCAGVYLSMQSGRPSQL